MMNHYVKKAAAYTLSAVVLSGTLAFLPTRTEVQAEGEKQAYEDALAQYNLGSLGYFQEKADAGNQYAATAVRVLQTASTKAVDGTDSKASQDGLTHIGAADDATSLENMKTALELMKTGNQLRTTDNNFTGLTEWTVRDDIMAYAQASANMESKIMNHWIPEDDVYGDVPYGGENAAWGSDQPYNGWYTAEKKEWEDAVAKNPDLRNEYVYMNDDKFFRQVGHYLNIVTGVDMSGIAFNERGSFGSTSVQDFSSRTEGSVSWQDYYNDFMNYYNRVKGNLLSALDNYGVKMYRVYNPNSGEHFYTSEKKEFDHLVSLGWRDEGTGWYAPKDGDPVYRLYNKNGGEHHYTMSEKEKNALISAGWKDEGTGWYSDRDQTVPLYRQYNPNAFANNHNYTTEEKEKNYLIVSGWKDEGIGWYGISSGKFR